MNFHSSDYGLFLAAIFALFWLLRDRRGPRTVLLLGGSWFFYACWRADYLGLILFSTLLDYVVGGLLHRAPPTAARRRRLLLTASLVGNLGVLAVFKYYNFFQANVEALLADVGVHVPHLEVVLPVGISFYTFQTLSYTLDIYRGTLRPARNLLDFALFVAFFPQLVAGPIVRACDFLPQLDRRPTLTEAEVRTALVRIAQGLAKKVLLADTLGRLLVDRLYVPGSTVDGPEALLGLIAYPFQIYGDFCGYSDIAIGSALLLGFRLPMNFNAPLTAVSIEDFWRRWHISLSTWFRDYLYIPLGGNRGGRVRTWVNLLITGLISGLWHGAGWNFVIWGGLHGVMLTVNRIWREGRLPWPEGGRGVALGRVVTFTLFALTLVVFRSQSFEMFGSVMLSFVSGWDHLPGVPWEAWAALVVAAGTHWMTNRSREGLQTRLERLPLAVMGVFYALLFGVLAHAGTDAVPFIYFQF